MLQDSDTYITVKKILMVSIEKNLNSFLKKWLQKGFITKYTYFSLASSNSILPKAYGLPKIHKENYLFRIIVSSINLYPLASFLQKIISNSLIYNEKHVKNSFDLYKTPLGTRICSPNILISLDVISRYSRIFHKSCNREYY